MPAHKIPMQERFDTKFEQVTETGCWLWTACSDKDGYGKIQKDGEKCSAHRISWELSHGEIPDGLHVLHKCDTPACVNPNHLFLGTIQDNNADKLCKGRVSSGERHGRAKLSESDVRAIRADRSMTNLALALRFGVSKSLVGIVKNVGIWRGV